ncbi:hypothetical protein E2C01_069558 [Portunus trituberculatus]|uniref:Uncharacterized protein n=1 Tax=Portunus trituberculatus TaxID=210409 RepID=A0A5B7I345_PORTR|nr:hypothetical protein [Portunus trituberculatus]
MPSVFVRVMHSRRSRKEVFVGGGVEVLRGSVGVGWGWMVSASPHPSPPEAPTLLRGDQTLHARQITRTVTSESSHVYSQTNIAKIVVPEITLSHKTCRPDANTHANIHHDPNNIYHNQFRVVHIKTEILRRACTTNHSMQRN